MDPQADGRVISESGSCLRVRRRRTAWASGSRRPAAATPCASPAPAGHGDGGGARIEPLRRRRLVGAEDARRRADRHRDVQRVADRAALAGQGRPRGHQPDLHVGAGPVAARYGHHHGGGGRIFKAFINGQPEIPAGWAFDSEGVPTTDTPGGLYKGMLMPLGGYKGSGLAHDGGDPLLGAERRRHGQRSGRHPLPRQDGARQPDVPGDRRRALHAGGGVHGARGATGRTS